MIKISEILNKIDIVEIIGKYLKLAKKGQNYFAICPFHMDSNPSLTISKTKQIFKCFVCNVGGNAIKFLTLYHQCSLSKALNILKNDFNLDLDISQISNEDFHLNRIYFLNEMVAKWYHRFLLQDKNKQHLEYLLNRKISIQTIQKYQLGFADDSNIITRLCINENNMRNLLPNDNENIYSINELDQFSITNILNNGDTKDFFINRIIFPIWDKNNNIVGFSGRTINSDNNPKYLNSKTTPVFVKNEILYNINNVHYDPKIIYIVEGYFDLLSLIEIGINNCVATMGVNLSDYHIKLLKEKNAKNLILAFDNDDAGKQNTIKNCLYLAKFFNLYIINKYDKKYKDFNEILIDDKNILIDIINNYTHFSLYYLEYIINNELPDFNEIINFINNYGKIEYLNQYIKIINNKFDINIDEINKKINFKNYNLNNEETTDVVNVKNNTTESRLIDSSVDKIHRLQNRFLKIYEYCLYSKDYFFKFLSSIPDLNQYILPSFQQLNKFTFNYYQTYNYNTILTNNEKYKLELNESTDCNFEKKDIYKIIDYVKEKKDSIVYCEQEFNKILLSTEILVLEIKRSILLDKYNIEDENTNGILKSISDITSELNLKYKQQNLNNKK